MLSRILLIPFVLAALVFLYLAWEFDSSYGMYMVPFVMVSAAIYIFSPQIDWWWYQRRPPKLDLPVIHIMDKYIPFYQRLFLNEKKLFHKRLALFMIAKDFKAMVGDAVPEDVKAIIAFNAVMLTFGKEDYLLNSYEKIVVYPHPFPTPRYEPLHAVELFAEDGVLIFSAEHLMSGTLQPDKFFNIGLYAWAGVYREEHPAASDIGIGADSWPMIEAVGPYTQEYILEYMGLPEADPFQVATVLFLTFPERMKKAWPEKYAAFSKLLGRDPLGMVLTGNY